MKALVKYAPGEGNLDILDVPEPACGDNQVKVEVAFCGVCGTDLHVMHDSFRNYPPVILGHEIAGTVVETGRNVIGRDARNARDDSGCDRRDVRPMPVLPSRPVHSLRARAAAWDTASTAASRATSWFGPTSLYRIPDNFSLDEAAMSEPFAAAVQAVTEVTRVRHRRCGAGIRSRTDRAAVPEAAGGRGREDDRRGRGRRRRAAGSGAADRRRGHGEYFGADLAEVVREDTDGAGVDAALECAGHPARFAGVSEALRPLGRYTQVAICGREVQMPDRSHHLQATDGHRLHVLHRANLGQHDEDLRAGPASPATI